MINQRSTAMTIDDDVLIGIDNFINHTQDKSLSRSKIVRHLLKTFLNDKKLQNDILRRIKDGY